MKSRQNKVRLRSEGVVKVNLKVDFCGVEPDIPEKTILTAIVCLKECRFLVKRIKVSV